MPCVVTTRFTLAAVSDFLSGYPYPRGRFWTYLGNYCRPENGYHVNINDYMQLLIIRELICRLITVTVTALNYYKIN